MDLQAAETLARNLVDRHLVGWGFAWDDAKRRIGVCKYSTRTIGLSRPGVRLASEETVLDTILHEIAHAQVGGQHGHDNVWRVACIALGGSGRRTADTPAPAGDWEGTCPAGHVTHMYRAPQRVRACGRCCGRRFQVAHLYTWKHRGREVPFPTEAYRREWSRLMAQEATKRALRALA